MGKKTGFIPYTQCINKKSNKNSLQHRMATLEKIRSKSVLLIVVIGVALLAFIIGDAITNSRNIFGEHTTVAKIGDKKIDYTDYVKKREEMNSQIENMRRQNPAQVAGFDSQTLSQLALDEMVGETLIDEASDKAGIQTSNSQLSYYILQQPINPRISEIIQQLNAAGYSVSTPSQAYELIFNPQRNGITETEMKPFQNYWVAMEAETAQLVKRNTYQRLLSGTVRANDLDKKALYDDYISTRNVNIAYKPYQNIDREKYTADESEIKNEYNNLKGQYEVEEPTKDVAFVAVTIAPSDADRAASVELAGQTANALRAGDANLNKDLRKEGVAITHKKLREKDIPSGTLRDFLTSAALDSVDVIKEDIRGFQIVKVGPKTMEVDSIQVNLVQVASPSLAENALSKLNSGVSIDSISSQLSADSIFVQKEQWLPLYTAQGQTNVLEASMIDSLMNSGNKYISLLSSPQGSLIAQVVKKTNPVAIYEYDEVNYELKPSTETISEARTKLEDFITANPNAKDFIENATKEGYTLRNYSLTASTPAIPRMAGMNSFYPDSRQVVRWVLIDGKPGEVSHVYESKDAMSPALYAVAVLREYEDFVPLTNPDIQTLVAEKVRKDKYGNDLLTQYQPSATTVENAAQKMGVSANNNPQFRFGLNNSVMDAKVLGQIAGSQPGGVVLVKGDNGIYAFQVVSTATDEFPMNDSEYEQRYLQMVNPNLGAMLKGSKTYKNNIYKFEAGD